MARLSAPALALLGLAAVAVLSMVAYAATGARRDADAERRGARFLLGVGDFLIHWFLWLISPVERLSLRAGLGPDFYNLAGLVFGLASGVAIALGHLGWGALGIALSSVSDVMDGRMARARALVSPYGAFIDSTLDRFVEVFIFLGFVVLLRGFAYGPLAAAAAITGSLLVSYARARGESVGVLCKEGLMQRAERMVLTFAACLLDHAVTASLGWRPGTLVLWVLGLIAVGTFATAAHRTLWIAGKLKERG